MFNINDIHSDEYFRSEFDDNKILFFTIALEKRTVRVLIRIAVSPSQRFCVLKWKKIIT